MHLSVCHVALLQLNALRTCLVRRFLGIQGKHKTGVPIFSINSMQPLQNYLNVHLLQLLQHNIAIQCHYSTNLTKRLDCSCHLKIQLAQFTRLCIGALDPLL